MKRKLYLHIGTEKTGTTSIQEVLFRNNEKLPSLGYYFLNTKGRRDSRGLVSYCIGHDKNDDYFSSEGIHDSCGRKKYRDDLLKEVQEVLTSLDDEVHSVIVTSEHFHSRITTESEVQRIYDLLMPFFDDVEVICYLREQAATCTSLYSTAIKMGFSPVFDLFIKSCNYNNDYYNYYNMLNKWSSVFGLDKIKARVFDRNSFFNHDLIDDFFSKIDKELLVNIDTKVVPENESLNEYGQILGKAINVIFPSQGTDVDINFRRNLFDKLYEGFKGKGAVIDHEKSMAIYDEFNESNTFVNRDYFGQIGNMFSRPLPKDKKILLEDSLVINVVDVLSALLGKKVIHSDGVEILLRDTAKSIQSTNQKKAEELMKRALAIRLSNDRDSSESPQ